MVKQKRKTKTCKECGHVENISQAIYKCDCCKKILEEVHLTTSVWRNTEDSDPKGYHFCSWKCFLKKMSKVRIGHFMDFPLLDCGRVKPGLSVKEFWKAVRAFR